MINKIKQHILDNELSDAITLIEDRLFAIGDLAIPGNEEEFKKLIGLRIAVKSLQGGDDNVVLDFVRREKFPVKQAFAIKGHNVTVYAKNLFLFPCDAYINTIHIDKLFDLSDRSASMEFIKRLGREEVERQVGTQEIKLGDFIILKHPTLTAPVSYHIVCYYGDKETDMDALVGGLIKVLKHAALINQTILGSFPLGYGILPFLDEESKKSARRSIPDKIAESLCVFLFESGTKKFPEIFFNMVNPESMNYYTQAFFKWSQIDRERINALKEMSSKHRDLVETCCTNDPTYVEILKKVVNISKEESIILLLGETGVGKSFLAENIHKISNRNDHRFTSLNCATIETQYLDSKLFGWTKGSFTGADKDGDGIISMCEGGTLFIDEIGYANIDIQRKLLIFIETKKYRKFGEANERSANIRLIFGTNVNLESMVKENKFQSDFYERIAHRVFTLPALRERINDLDLLVAMKLSQLNNEKLYDITITPEAVEQLKKYPWSGNLRQLFFYVNNLYFDCHYTEKNVINTAMIMQSPPRSASYQDSGGFDSFELLLSSYIEKWIEKWDQTKGGFIDDFISPIVAKCYLNDLKKDVTKSGKYLGLGGTRGEESTVIQRMQKYNTAKENSPL
jgi:DNA-binding NtrC family response regulator